MWYLTVSVPVWQAPTCSAQYPPVWLPPHETHYSCGTANGPILLPLLPLSRLSCYRLPQEAAAANSLSDVRFKLLNVALMTAGLGHILILGPRFNGGGPLLPLVRPTRFGVLATRAVRRFHHAQALVGVAQQCPALSDLSLLLCRHWCAVCAGAGHLGDSCPAGWPKPPAGPQGRRVKRFW